MNAVDYLKEKARMCKATTPCSGCGLKYIDEGITHFCTPFEDKYPEKAVAIVEKWAKENPVKTYLSILLEKFPYGKRKSLGAPIFCPHDLFNIEQRCPETSCKDCWNRECEEAENE